MAIENFKPTIWRARLLENLRKNHVFAQVANDEYSGDISAAGDTVKIGGIGSVSVNDYDGAISYEELEDASTKLTVDQEKYFAFKVDDVDAAQSNANEMDEAMDEASHGLDDEADKYIAGLYTDAGLSVNGTDTFETDHCYETFAETKRKLMENDVPGNMPLWCVVNPQVWEAILIDEIDTSTDNISAMGEGAITATMGFDLYVSNNLAANRNMAGTYRSIGFAEQIIETEALRLEDYFADAVRGLYVYGAKVIKNDELVDIQDSN